ncbi:sensor histidine kinase [Sphingobacterium wenxiniae]|uniref:histidine kinase n=1 Tax=Sphingobacterium wenxiniae TaxID=683125 RepID=A0A1I6VLY3_9SPHI|nr:HAMP domain-containing sensor histidine kinase [Sphingobacterium wenxiniae]SFT14713.1 Signal transduction histidine kinase [Sphingobacterium wenxiniae]
MKGILLLYKRLINIGVYKDISYLENRRTQMLNFIALCCVPLTLFFTIYNFSDGRYILSAINAGNFLVSFLVYPLHYNRQYGKARFILLGFNFILFASGSYFFHNGAIYFLLSAFIVSILVYDKRWIPITTGILTVIIIILVEFYPFPNLMPTPLPEGRKMFNMVTAILFIGFIISFFKHIQYGYQNKIREQNEQLKGMNRNMQKLFSIISHDIKSPLASLQNTLMLFRQNLLSEETTKEFVHQINKRVSHLNITIENLLQWSSSNLQDIQAHPDHISLLGAVKETSLFLEGIITHKNITLDIHIDPELFVFADRNQLAMILRNVINNAIKFSYSDDVIAIIATSDKKNITLQIIDNGMGITEEQSNLLFQTLQSPTFGTQGERGSGIGLLLTNELVQQNQGSIAVKKNKERGTTFTIILPVGTIQRKIVLA